MASRASFRPKWAKQPSLDRLPNQSQSIPCLLLNSSKVFERALTLLSDNFGWERKQDQIDTLLLKAGTPCARTNMGGEAWFQKTHSHECCSSGEIRMDDGNQGGQVVGEGYVE